MLDRLVNLIPVSLSGEGNQDSEPNIAVDPQQPTNMVATAFTADPLHGPNAPIYVSTDGGQTWSLRTVVPGDGPFGTGDITVGFATEGGVLYAGILSANAPSGQTRLQILRTANFASTTTMQVLVDRLDVDQPWVVAGTVRAAAGPRDHVYVGSNDFSGPQGRTASVDVSLDAATSAPPANFQTRRVEHSPTIGQDGPPVRLAVHGDGTVYAVHQRWNGGGGQSITMDVVVTRDDNGGAGNNAFSALTDSGNGSVGQRVATGRHVVFNATMGQERLGADSAIAVDPTDSDNVWIAWGDRPQGAGSSWTIHVRRSTDRGQTWSAELRTVTKGKNPALAVNSAGQVGFSCQQLTGRGSSQRWVTTFEVTNDGWTTKVTPTVLHRALALRPVHTFLPYLGDYTRLLAVDQNFHGVFCGSNHPDQRNFPAGVTYQRNVDWNTRTLLDLDGATPVPDSIDPFYFLWAG